MLSTIEACIPALRRYALALLRDRQDADDLVHDCLVRALDRLHTHRDAGDIRAWLFSIMHNLFVTQTRHSRARPDTAALDDESSQSAPGGQEMQLRWKELVGELNAMPDEQRAVVLLVCVEDLTYAEAARALGVPIGTVMSRLSRGRERLRRLNQDRAAPGKSRPCLRRVK